MIELNDISSDIRFDESEHRYIRVFDSKELCGVTTMLRKVGLSVDYGDIPDDVLYKAADRGHMVHLLCDMTDKTAMPVNEFDEIQAFSQLSEKGIIKQLEKPCGMSEANEYLRLVREEKLIPVASEYLISDFEYIASCIDNVFTTETLMEQGKVILGDKKTTSSLHEEPLRWQLSIYKRLFEKQNPNLQVVGLIGIWLPKPQYGSPKIVDVKEYSAAEVDAVISRFLNGITYKEQPTEMMMPYPAVKLSEITRSIEILKRKEELYRQELLEWMVENDVKTLKSENATITYVCGTLTKRFDSTSFKKDHAELYEKYCKETMKKESLRININK